MEIRRATADDADAIAALDAATKSPTSSIAPERDPGPPFDEDRSPRDVIVASVGGEVVGYTRLRHPLPFESNRHVLEIRGFAVDPEHQRRGVGRALLDATLEEARRRGARKLSLRVLSSNPGARRLYEAAGFEVEGVLREEFLLAGEYVDDVLMARYL